MDRNKILLEKGVVKKVITIKYNYNCALVMDLRSSEYLKSPFEDDIN